MNEKWYTIEKGVNGYTVWLNIETIENGKGGGGCLGIYTGRTKKECIQYCKEHNIKLEN